MVDSWPRLPSGLSRKGPLFFLGDYDLCMKMALDDSIVKAKEAVFGIHYCRSNSKVNLPKVSTSITTGALVCY